MMILAHQALGECPILTPSIDECVDDARSHISVATCIMQKASVSQMVRCVGVQNNIGCSTPNGFHWFDDGPNIEAIDTNKDGVYCVTPVSVLQTAAKSAKCQDYEAEYLAAIHRCPLKDNNEAYLACLCDEIFDNEDRDVLDECIGTSLLARVGSIDFTNICARHRATHRPPQPITG